MVWEAQRMSFCSPNFNPHFRPPIAVHFPPQPARAPEQTPTNDLSSTISSAGDLCSRAEWVMEQARKLAESSSSNSCSPAPLLSCPFDCRHTMPASSLLYHSLRCPSSPFNLSEEAATLVSSLRYLQPEAQTPRPACGFDPTGIKFCYNDSPGPVRFHQEKSSSSPALPEFFRASFEGEPPEFDRLLPSQCWALQEEVRAWSFLPGSYSFYVMVSAMGVKLEKEWITELMLVSSAQRGVVLDPALADHLFVLVSLFLRSVQREALELGRSLKPSSGYGGFHCKCPVLLESGNWLVSQLLGLFQPPAAGLFVLGLLQSSLIKSARRSALEFQVEAGADDENKPATTTTSSEVEQAFSALKERADLESYLRARVYINNLTKAALVNEYDILVSNASVERQLRPGFRPILEHDGLASHRQNTEESKLKTKEEVLADERDYKRRRQTYKGKKLRRTPAQVLRDIIEAQMNDIVAAGGIGSFRKDFEPSEENRRNSSESPSRRYDSHYKKEFTSSSSMRYDHHQSREPNSRRYEHKARHSSPHHDEIHMSKRDKRGNAYSEEHVKPHGEKAAVKGRVTGVDEDFHSQISFTCIQSMKSS